MEVDLKVVNLTSFKGGAGKTTTAMLVATALVKRDVRVALIDADENQPLVAWQDVARTNGHWDEQCIVRRGDDMASLDQAYDEALASDVDVLIIDTRGGGSELNNACALTAGVVIVPTALTGLDMDAALATFEYVVRLIHDHRQRTPVRLLMQRVPIGRLSRSQERDLQLLATLPVLQTRLHQRDAFGSIAKRGMLHLVLQSVVANERTRIAASHMWSAMAEAVTLADEIVTKVGED